MKRQLVFEPNPILVKELRGRMRGPRAFIFLTAILVLLGLVSYGLIQIVTPRVDGGFQSGTTGVVIGQTVFYGLAFLILAMVCVVAPSLTAGAISGEHQHKTFDLLVSTPLRPATILVGKLLAALSYVALLLLAAVPMMSLAYVFGGVTVQDLLKAFAVMCSFGIAFAVIGMFFSALFVRTGLAVSASFVLVAFCLFGTFFIYIVVGSVQGTQPPSWILAPNPISALASVLTSDLANPNQFGGGSFQSLLGGLAGRRFDNVTTSEPALWNYTAGIYVWVTVVLFLLTTQLIKPVQRFHFRRVTWVLIALFLLGSIVVVISVYGPYKFTVVRAIIRWTTTPPYELVQNGNFSAPPDTAWNGTSMAVDSQQTTDPLASFQVVNDHGKNAVRMMNTSETVTSQTLTQVLDKSLPEYGELKLQVVLRLSPHTQIVCGAKGDVCPLEIKLDYEDADGKPHVWEQGLYARGKPNNKTAPPRCRTCENRGMNVRAPENKWYTYDSPDLMAPDSRMISPRVLRAVTLTGSGTQFETQVAQVSLMLHEGRPLIETYKTKNNYGWNWRSVVPWWITSIFDGGAIPGIGFPNRGVFIEAQGRPMPPPPMPVIIQAPMPTAESLPQCVGPNGSACP